MTHPIISELADIAFQNTRDGIMITDAKNIIVYINQAFTSVTGYSKEDAIGNPPTILQSGNHDKQFFDKFWQKIEQKGHWEGEIWDKRKNGEIYLEYLSITTQKDSNNNITHYVAVFTDIQEKYESKRKLERVIHNDELTELANRDRILHSLKSKLKESRRKHELLAVISLDLDNFKKFNDQHGHLTGDRLLVILAKRLKSLIRETDLVGRMGGDEFVIILPNLNHIDEAEKMAERVLNLVASTIELDGQKFSLSTSLGMTIFPFDDAEADMLLRHADQAMYKAKENGKNQSHLFDIEKDQEAQTRQELVSQLKAAITNNELVLHYQPKVNMRTGKVIGVEALIRWQHPTDGLLAPGVFLPHIEYHDLIVDVGNWVLRDALSQLEIWLQQGLDITVSVNVAAKQLLKRDFVDSLNNILKDFPNVSPKYLELEILESSALDNIEHVVNVINKCRELGIKFSLDDFGTGYASLSYLRDIPVDVLKIDQSFVFNLLENKKDLSLIEGIVGLATAFQRDVIAEGVETTEQGILLMRLGCDLGQGYGIAKPMPANKVLDWVKEFKPDKEWSVWADTKWEMGDFPLLVAQYDHINWVKRILMQLDGYNNEKVSVSSVTDHYECRFGHWYYEHGIKRYHNFKSFIELEPIHINVHKIGGQIIKLINKGDIDEAKSLVKHLLILKDQVLEKLANLQSEVASNSSFDLNQ